MGTFTATWNHYDRKTNNQQYTGNFTTVIKFKIYSKSFDVEIFASPSRYRFWTSVTVFRRMLHNVTDRYLTFTENSLSVGSDRLYPRP